MFGYITDKELGTEEEKIAQLEKWEEVFRVFQENTNGIIRDEAIELWDSGKNTIPQFDFWVQKYRHDRILETERLN